LLEQKCLLEDRRSKYYEAQVEALREAMDDLEQPKEKGRELILNMSFRVEIQAQGQMEAKRNFFFSFIEKQKCETLRYAESQQQNYERKKTDVRRPEKTFAWRDPHGRDDYGRKYHGKESQGKKNTSKFKKRDIPKFHCVIGCGDKINIGVSFSCFQFRKKERLDRVQNMAYVESV